MTSIGKGRGWATPRNRDAVLRRPGPVISQKNPDHLHLIDAIDSLNLYNPTPMSTIDEIEGLFQTSVRQKGLRIVFDTLHTQALEDRHFGIKLAMIFSYDKISNQQDEDGTILRNMLLRSLQIDYETKDEIKDKCAMHYLNAMSLLGEVYYQIRLSNGKPLRVLAIPLLDYMKALLQSASEEDIELVTTQLSLNGKNIHASNRMELEQFLIHVRTVLVNRNLSSQSRAMLLLVVDLANQLYKPLSGDLQAFYLAQLGEETMMQLQRYQSVKNTIKPKDQVNDSTRTIKYDIDQKEKFDTTNSGVGISSEPFNIDTGMKFQVSQKPYEQNLSGTIDSVSNSSSNASHVSLPRAIRGLGVREHRRENTSDKKPKGKKDKLTDEQVWFAKQNNSSKGWGHDDRFERDYEQDRSGTHQACNNANDS